MLPLYSSNPVEARRTFYTQKVGSARLLDIHYPLLAIDILNTGIHGGQYPFQG
jgi:hypothetical protein